MARIDFNELTSLFHDLGRFRSFLLVDFCTSYFLQQVETFIITYAGQMTDLNKSAMSKLE